MHDLVICTVPYLETYLPPAAAATLKGHLETKNFTVGTIDLNIIVADYVTDIEQYNQLCVFFSGDNLDYELSRLNNNEKILLDNVVDLWSKSIIQLNTKHLGLSVFSVKSRIATELLVKHLKQIQYPNPIVIGGQGVDDPWARSLSDYIDCWILGEGEIALEKYLKGKNYAGINKKDSLVNLNIQIDDLDQLGPADYTEYDLSKYSFYNKSTVQITGSRGCVRKCTFCDVYQKWPKYRWRSGESIANEIISIHQKTNVTNFFFTDSLINGNMKSFNDLCIRLADYKEKHAPELTWGGQFIVRRVSSLPKNYFEMLAKSGAYNLTIGVETGSDKVREHMKKGFYNVDLDYHMEQFSELGITCGFLMLSGYPTETQEDFEETLKMLQRYHGYAANGTILGITLGSTLLINKEVPLSQYTDILFSIPDHSKNSPMVADWLPTEVNKDLTLHERIRRRLVTEVVAQAYGWKLTSSDRELQLLTSLYEQYQS